MRRSLSALSVSVLMFSQPALAQSYEETAMYVIYGVTPGASIKNRLGISVLKLEPRTKGYNLFGYTDIGVFSFVITSTGPCVVDAVHGISPDRPAQQKNYYKYTIDLRTIDRIVVKDDPSSPTGKYGEVFGADPKCTIVTSSDSIPWNEKPCPARLTTYATQERLDKAIEYLHKNYCPKRAF